MNTQYYTTNILRHVSTQLRTVIRATPLTTKRSPKTRTMSSMDKLINLALTTTAMWSLSPH